MKRKILILGVLATLCLLGTAYYAWTIYDVHCKQVAEWNEGAKAAFEEALWLEVNKRAETPIFHYSSEHSGMKTLNAKIPETVRMMTPEGFLKYNIERKKYDLSLIKDTERRALLGALLETNPLSIDTLMIQWDSLLANRQVPGRSLIRYVYTDWELRDDTICVPVDEKIVRSDSLTTRYLGFRCEHEVTAFVSYPYWLSSISGSDYCILSFPWILLLLLIVSYSKLEVLVKRKLMREKVIEKEIIVEKEVYIADIQIEKAKIFRLEDDSFFDSLVGSITKGDFSHALPPQTALLLKLFLCKENHRLSTNEIQQELWKGQGTTAQLHKAIQRLRMELKKVSSDIVIKNVNGDYELKLSISSKK